MATLKHNTAVSFRRQMTFLPPRICMKSSKLKKEKKKSKGQKDGIKKVGRNSLSSARVQIPLLATRIVKQFV